MWCMHWEGFFLVVGVWVGEFGAGVDGGGRRGCLVYLNLAGISCSLGRRGGEAATETGAVDIPTGGSGLDGETGDVTTLLLILELLCLGS